MPKDVTELEEVTTDVVETSIDYLESRICEMQELDFDKDSNSRPYVSALLAAFVAGVETVSGVQRAWLPGLVAKDRRG